MRATHRQTTVQYVPVPFTRRRVGNCDLHICPPSQKRVCASAPRTRPWPFRDGDTPGDVAQRASPMRARRRLVAALHLALVMVLLSLCAVPATASDFARVRHTVAVATYHTIRPLRFDSQTTTGAGSAQQGASVHRHGACLFCVQRCSCVPHADAVVCRTRKWISAVRSAVSLLQSALRCFASCSLPLSLTRLDNNRQGAPCTTSPVEKENCVLRCTSQHCYDRVYGTDALEEGEIDNLRGRVFRACVRTEIRNEQLREAQTQSGRE